MRRIHNSKLLRPYRKNLRNHATPAEMSLWAYLKNSKLGGVKFRRQHSIGNYIVDFYCPSQRIAIELDGDIHKYDNVNSRDRNKQVYLDTLGIKLLRFENQLVFTNLENVLQEIVSCFNHPPNPLLD